MTSTALAVNYPENVSQIFEEVALDSFADLLHEHDRQASRMQWLADMVLVESNAEGELDVLRYFATGNNLDGAAGIAKYLFRSPRALKALSADYWSKAMALTDVYETMPADDKREWCELLERYEDGEKVSEEWDGDEYVVQRETLPAVPDFTAENIQATFAQLLADRRTFFAKRVDGVFRALSPDHKTNRPQGFRSRLIMANVLGDWGRWSSLEYLRDLRRVIGTFMGRGELDNSTTFATAKWAQREHRGQWVWLDGNSWAIRCYQNGNVHVKLHEEMVYRLNMVLASLYPQALAAEALARPKRKRKGVQLLPDVISFQTGATLREARRGIKHENSGYVLYIGDTSKAGPDLRRVLRHLGGARSEGGHFWTFPYHPGALIDEVVATGVVPGTRSHQFYPTPEDLAARLVEAADIYPGCSVLEPSAGTGNLVQAIIDADKDARVLAVEVAQLHADVLKSRFSLTVEHDNFLHLTSCDLGEFDRVVMNPPFANGQAREHIEHAANMLRPGGKLATIAPLSCRDLKIKGCCVEVVDEVTNAFEDTSISVLIIIVEKFSRD